MPGSAEGAGKSYSEQQPSNAYQRACSFRLGPNNTVATALTQSFVHLRGISDFLFAAAQPNTRRADAGTARSADCSVQSAQPAHVLANYVQEELRDAGLPPMLSSTNLHDILREKVRPWSATIACTSTATHSIASWPPDGRSRFL
jgi:hypothetical protein